MRIIELKASNVKRLKAVDITPNFTLNQITGRNGSGKSSLLDSIWYALAGKEVIPGKPVREGCEKASIRLNLGEIVVERKFSATGSTSVSVTNADGSNWKSPQTMLDALLGELSFDPLAFSRKKPREQFDELRKVSKLPIDIDTINAANTADYERRTNINREAKQKRAQAEAITIPTDVPTEPTSESDLLDGIEEAGKFNADIERRRGNRVRAQQEASDLVAQADIALNEVPKAQSRCEARVIELQRQMEVIREESASEISALKSRAETAISKADSLRSQLENAGPLPEPISISGLRTSLDAARASNSLLEKRKQRDGMQQEAIWAEEASQKLTDQIAAREKQVADAIRAADMPVAWLGFGANHVTFNGIPFEQSSDAERLRVSTAIAMAANPKLRIVRIKDGSLLDEDGMKLIAKMAHEKDFQVFVEVVDTSGKIGIFMEDGEVAAVNP